MGQIQGQEEHANGTQLPSSLEHDIPVHQDSRGEKLRDIGDPDQAVPAVFRAVYGQCQGEVFAGQVEEVLVLETVHASAANHFLDVEVQAEETGDQSPVDLDAGSVFAVAEDIRVVV